MKRILFLLAIAIMAISGGFALNAKNDEKKDNRQTVCFTVAPAMHCQNCVNKIKKNLRFEKGITAIEPSLEKQIVEITYDKSKTDNEKIVKAFKKIGYTATVAEDTSCNKCDKNTK